jgi:hypothetical protein
MGKSEEARGNDEYNKQNIYGIQRRDCIVKYVFLDFGEYPPKLMKIRRAQDAIRF